MTSIRDIGNNLMGTRSQLFSEVLDHTLDPFPTLITISVRLAELEHEAGGWVRWWWQLCSLAQYTLVVSLGLTPLLAAVLLYSVRPIAFIATAWAFLLAHGLAQGSVPQLLYGPYDGVWPLVGGIATMISLPAALLLLHREHPRFTFSLKLLDAERLVYYLAKDPYRSRQSGAIQMPRSVSRLAAVAVATYLTSWGVLHAFGNLIDPGTLLPGFYLTLFGVSVVIFIAFQVFLSPGTKDEDKWEREKQTFLLWTGLLVTGLLALWFQSSLPIDSTSGLFRGLTRFLVPYIGCVAALVIGVHRLLATGRELLRLLDSKKPQWTKVLGHIRDRVAVSDGTCD